MARKRISKLAYIVVPSKDLKLPELINLTKRGCRAAHEAGFEPINPLIHYGPFLGEDELTGPRIKPKAMWWLHRCSHIIVCIGDWVLPELDPLSYTILASNEMVGLRPRQKSKGMRRPTKLIGWEERFCRQKVKRLTPLFVRRWLGTNLTSAILLEEDEDDVDEIL